MGVIEVCLISSLIIYTICSLIRYIIRLLFVHALRNYFDEKLSVLGGYSTLSFEILSGIGKSMKMEARKGFVNFFFLSFLGLRKLPVCKISLEAFNLDIPQISKIPRRKRRPITFENWLVMKFISFFFIFFIRSAQLTLNNIIIKINGKKYSLKNISFELNRSTTDLEITFNASILEYYHDLFSFSIPRLSFSIKGQPKCLQYFLSSGFSQFHFESPSISFHYLHGDATLDPIKIRSTIEESNETINLDINSIIIHFPEYDFHTYSFAIQILSLSGSSSFLNTGMIESYRNDQSLIKIPFVHISKNAITLGDLDATISTPLIIDVGLLGRTFFKKHYKGSQNDSFSQTDFYQNTSSNEPFYFDSQQKSELKLQNFIIDPHMEDMKNKEHFHKSHIKMEEDNIIKPSKLQKNITQDSFDHGRKKNKITDIFSKLSIVTETLKVHLALSDTNILDFIAEGVEAHLFEVTARQIIISAVFPTSIHTLVKGKDISFNFEAPNLSIKGRKGTLIMTTAFAEAFYFQHTFGIFSFIERQIKGETTSEREKHPPFRRILSFEIKKGSYIWENSKFTASIFRSNEAKRAAFEALQLRQAKAIQILNARLKTHHSHTKHLNQEEQSDDQKRESLQFYPESFDKESVRMFFNLYREALRTMPEEPAEVMSGRGTNISFVMNGITIPNKAEAVSIMKKIEPNLQTDTVGHVGGGAISFYASEISVRTPHIEDTFRFEEVTGSGYLFFARNKGKDHNDFYHIVTTCDQGQIEFDLPRVSSLSVTFVQALINSKKGKMKMTTAQIPFFMDMKMETIKFRKRPYCYNRTSFVDTCRFRFREKLEMNCDDFRIEYNDRLRAFAPSPYIEIACPKSSISFDGDSYVFDAASMNIRVEHDSALRRVAIFPNPHFVTRLPCTNSLNPSGERPVFIPIDSTRMMDPNYDPFEIYRTSEFHTEVKCFFNWNVLKRTRKDGVITSNQKKHNLDQATIDFDLVPPILNHFLGQMHKRACTLYPARFATKIKPITLYKYTEISVEFPPLSIFAFQNQINIKLQGNGLHFLFSNQREITVILEGSTVIPATYESQQFFNINAKGIHYSIHGKNQQFFIDQIDIETNSTSLRQISKLSIPKIKIDTIIPYHNPKITSLYPKQIKLFEKLNKDNISEHPNLKSLETKDQFPIIFQNSVFRAEISTLSVRIHLVGAMNNISIDRVVELKLTRIGLNRLLPDLNYVIINPATGKANGWGLDIKCSLIEMNAGGPKPILQIKEIFIILSMLEKQVLLDSSINLIEASIAPEYVEIYQLISKLGEQIALMKPHITGEIPSDDNYYEEPSESSEISESVTKSKTILQSERKLLKFNIFVSRILEEVVKSDGTPMAHLNLDESSFIVEDREDGSEEFQLKLQDIRIQQDQAIDSFTQVFETTKKENPIIFMKAVKTKKLMKCPVFDIIEINVNDFIIRIPLPFIRQLIEMFPSSESLRLLDLDAVENEDESTDDESSVEEISERFKESEGKNMFFCRHFIFYPFHAELNFRRKAQGAFKEFLGRPFDYHGLTFYDVFGTRNQLTTVVKKNIKWTIIKALPSFFFKKNKHVSVTLKQGLEKSEKSEESTKN